MFALLRRTPRFGIALMRSSDETDGLVQSGIGHMLDRLPEQQRRALFLVFIDGYSHAEAADTVRILMNKTSAE